MSQRDVRAGRAYILIEAIDNTHKTFRNVARSLENMAARFFNAGKQFSIIGAGMVAPNIKAVNAASDFSDEVLYLMSVLKITKAEGQDLIDVIKTLGTTSSYNATEVTKAAIHLAQGGFNKQQIKDSLQAVIDMSRGARMEMGPTAEVLVDTLTLFNMNANRASEVADKFFIAAKNGTIDVEDLAMSFSYTAQSAAQMGLSLDETLGILSAMSLRMLKASKAGTSLNQFITGLASRADKIQELLNINPLDASGSARPILPILMEISQVFDQLSNAKKIKVAEEIFNVRGARAVAAVTEGLQTIREGVKEIKDSAGAARKAAEMMDSGIGGALRRLQAQFHMLFVEWGNALENTLRATERVIGPIVAFIAKWIRANHEAIIQASLMMVAFAALGPAFILAGVALNTLAMSIRSTIFLMTPVIETVRTLTNALKLLATPINILPRIFGVSTSAISISTMGFIGLAGAIGRIPSLIIDVTRSFIRATPFIVNTFTAGMPHILSMGQAILIAGLRVVKFTMSMQTAGKIALFFGGTLGYLQQVGQTATKIIGSMVPVLTALARGFMFAYGPAISLFSALMGPMAALLANPFVQVAIGIAAMYLAWETFGGKIIDGIKDFAKSSWEYLSQLPGQFMDFLSSLKTLIPSFDRIGEAWNNVVRIFSESFTNSWRSAQKFFGALFDIGKDTVEKVQTLLGEGKVEQAFEVAMVALKGSWELLVDELTNQWLDFVDTIKEAFYEIKPVAMKIVAEIRSALAEGMLDSAKKTNDQFSWDNPKSWWTTSGTKKLWDSIVTDGVNVEEEIKRGQKMGFDAEQFAKDSIKKDIFKGVDEAERESAQRKADLQLQRAYRRTEANEKRRANTEKIRKDIADAANTEADDLMAEWKDMRDKGLGEGAQPDKVDPGPGPIPVETPKEKRQKEIRAENIPLPAALTSATDGIRQAFENSQNVADLYEKMRAKHEDRMYELAQKQLEAQKAIRDNIAPVQIAGA